MSRCHLFWVVGSMYAASQNHEARDLASPQEEIFRPPSTTMMMSSKCTSSSSSLQRTFANTFQSSSKLLQQQYSSPSSAFSLMKFFSPLRTLATTSSALSMSSKNNINNKDSSPLPPLRGIVFDMDGTLTVPNLDFAKMYQDCGIKADQDILYEMKHNMSAERAAECQAIIDQMEQNGRDTLQLMPGAHELLTWCRAHHNGSNENIPTAIVTRNTKLSVDRLEELLSLSSQPEAAITATPTLQNPFQQPHVFDVIISRDDESFPPKPDPASLRHILQKWGITNDNVDHDNATASVVMVGDSPANDVAYGKAAGTTTVLVDSGRRFVATETAKQQDTMMTTPDCIVQHLWEIPRWLWLNREIPGPLGTHAPLLKYDTPIVSTNLVAHQAAADGNVKLLEEQLAKMEDDESKLQILWEACPETGNTPLIWAANAGHANVVQFLLSHLPTDQQKKEECLNIRGYLGATALSRAACRGHTECLQLLAAAAVPSRISCLDIPNDKMQYPLHFAAFKQHLDCVHILLEHGANPFVLDRKGRTPSLDTSNAEIRQVLEQAMQERLLRTVA